MGEGKGATNYWLTIADPEGILPLEERRARAVALRSREMARRVGIRWDRVREGAGPLPPRTPCPTCGKLYRPKATQ